MKKLCALASVAVLALSGNPAVAASRCYMPEQTHAEHLLRLHSELLVITVTCRQGSRGQDLPAAYAAFTKKNLDVLRNAEHTMQAFYKSSEKGNPVRHLDRLRTKLGNEYGQKVAQMSAPDFCAVFRDKVLELNAADPATVAHLAKQLEHSARAYMRPCKKVAAFDKKD